MESFVPDSRDQRIHEIIRDLCAKLRVQIVPHKLLWVEWVKTADSGKGSKRIGSEEVYFKKDTTILPWRMRDKMEPEDWRPLLASALFLGQRLWPGLVRKIWRRLVFPPLIMALVAIYFIVLWGPLDSTGRPDWAFLLLIFSLNACMWLPLFFHGIYFQRARLVADREAARLVGKDAFLDVMRKLDQMGLPDLENSKGRHWWKGRLGIDVRINSLLGYSM